MSLFSVWPKTGRRPQKRITSFVLKKKKEIEMFQAK